MSGCRIEGSTSEYGFMDAMQAVGTIKDRLHQAGGEASIELLRGGSFRARLVPGGIEVDNLGTQPRLPWAVFQEAITVLHRNGGKAKRGDAMNSRLGEPGLPLDSIEGHIAHAVYGKQPGDTVFRRITPIACILIWAGMCRAGKGALELYSNSTASGQPTSGKQQ